MASATGITPEDRAANGKIPNPSIDEYYLGDLPAASSQQGFISGAVAGQKASVSWYKFQADGVSPYVFDQFGSSYGFGGGGTFVTGGPAGTQGERGQLLVATFEEAAGIDPGMTAFGFMLSGDDVLRTIDTLASQDGLPTQPVTITSISVARTSPVPGQ